MVLDGCRQEARAGARRLCPRKHRGIGLIVGLIERNQLIAKLSPPLDNLLAAQLVDEFVSQERRYIQRDWEPAELDGGQFCEVLARILHHVDSGNLSRGKDFDECASYIEKEDAGIKHLLQPRKTALHLIRVLRTIYKFRSQRGAIHISPTYGPNHMDSRMMIENVRWAMNETLRVLGQGDCESIAKAIRELLQFDVPCIGVFDEVIMVQRTDLGTDEEILVLLHYAGERGFTRKELGQFAMHQAPRVTEAVQRLEAPNCRQIVMLNSGRYRLTDLGSRHIREKLADKLLVQ